jgi:putative ABC transport system permease protein
MILQSLKKTWKNKRKSRMLLFEFFLSFILLFGLISMLGKYIHNKKSPLGFNYQQVWSGILEPQIEFSDSAILSIKKEMFQRIRSYNEVISLTELQHNLPFIRNKTYSNRFRYKEDNFNRIFAFGADDYLDDVLGLKLVEGRWFDESDNSSNYRPVIINQTLRKKLGKKEQVIGSRAEFHYRKEQCIIVGVVEDFRYAGDYSRKENQLFFRCSLEEYPNYNHVDAFGGYDVNSQSVHDQRIYFKVKPGTGLDFEALLLEDLNQHFPDWKIKIDRLEDQRTKYLESFWLPLILLIGVSLFLVFNVVIGLFAVLWYNINTRKTEIGIRIANGATKNHIYTQLIIELLWLSTLGIIPSIIVALQFPILGVNNIETSIYIQSMLISMSIIYLLVIISAILPSRQAAKIQPAMALHEE